MIKLGRVSTETRGLFILQDFVEDVLTCSPGNQIRREDAGCPI